MGHLFLVCADGGPGKDHPVSAFGHNRFTGQGVTLFGWSIVADVHVHRGCQVAGPVAAQHGMSHGFVQQGCNDAACCKACALHQFRGDCQAEHSPVILDTDDLNAEMGEQGIGCLVRQS